MTDLALDTKHFGARRMDPTSTAARLVSSLLLFTITRSATTSSPSQNPASLRRGFASEEGFSLVEMMVTVTIMSILLTVSAMMFTTLFQGEIQARQFQDQDSTSHEVASFLDSRMDHVKVGAIGLPGTAPSTVEGTSLAGDQVVFTAEDHCYRVFYVERTEEVNVAVSSDVADDCAEIRPVRGPNQRLADGSFTAAPGSPLFDAVLDDPSMLAAGASVFNLATGIETKDDAPAPTELGLLSFWDAANNSIAIPLQAGSALGDYPASVTSQVAMVRLSAEVLASSDPQVREQQFTKPMDLSRDFYLGQS